MATIKKTPAKKTAKADVKAVKNTEETQSKNVTKRDFLVLSASGVAAAGAGAAVWPFVRSMSPAADVLALSTIEQDVSNIEEGQMVKILWQGKPVFIRRRTKQEIQDVRNVKISDLKDQELVKDEDRVLKGREQWLVLIGVCTHLGCIPIGNKGEFGGFFCPCHGSHYDISGRIRKGPAPRNLEIPKYEFLSDSVIKIG